MKNRPFEFGQRFRHLLRVIETNERDPDEGASIAAPDLQRLMEGFRPHETREAQFLSIGPIAAIAQEKEKQHRFRRHLREAVNVASRSRSSQWHSDLSTYHSLAMTDYSKFLDAFYIWMNCDRTNLFYDGTLATHLNYGDFGFSNRISPIPGTKSEEFRIYMSGGTLMALDDLAFRVFCNSDFLSREIGDQDRLWDGCTCFFAHLHNYYLRPEIRYWNYNMDFSPLLVGCGRNEPVFAPFFPLYYSGIPTGDPERITAASFAATIGLSWLLAHEEAHYRNGHFHFLSGPKPEGKWFDYSEELPGGAPAETFLSSEPFVQRALEWNADTTAWSEATAYSSPHARASSSQ